MNEFNYTVIMLAIIGIFNCLNGIVKWYKVPKRWKEKRQNWDQLINYIVIIFGLSWLIGLLLGRG